MLKVDEIRCERITVADVLRGNPTRPNGDCSHQFTGGPFYCPSSLVVNRLPVQAGKEKNAPSAGPGASASLLSEDLLSSATSRLLEARPSRPIPADQEGVGGKKKDELYL